MFLFCNFLRISLIFLIMLFYKKVLFCSIQLVFGFNAAHN